MLIVLLVVLRCEMDCNVVWATTTQAFALVSSLATIVPSSLVYLATRLHVSPQTRFQRPSHGKRSGRRNRGSDFHLLCVVLLRGTEVSSKV